MKGTIMEDLVVRAAGLSKAYRNGAIAAPVLQGIDLEITRGECLFLVGPSGSGKTTLLSILGCVLSADGGVLEILGEDVTRYSSTEQARFRREKVGFVFQRFHLFDALTAVENVRVAFELMGIPSAEATRLSRDLLALVGLADKADSRVTCLSMGQRQRVALARALAGDPELILADEPTASLDADSGFHAMQVLKDLCHSLQKTVVVVTHDSRILPIADRILKLADGRIVADQPPGNPPGAGGGPLHAAPIHRSA
ncbi:MAG: ABC transporter ATP-binding protein [Deltaproteobacteria bacterium]